VAEMEEIWTEKELSEEEINKILQADPGAK